MMIHTITHSVDGNQWTLNLMNQPIKFNEIPYFVKQPNKKTLFINFRDQCKKQSSVPSLAGYYSLTIFDPIQNTLLDFIFLYFRSFTMVDSMLLGASSSILPTPPDRIATNFHLIHNHVLISQIFLSNDLKKVSFQMKQKF